MSFYNYHSLNDYVLVSIYSRESTQENQHIIDSLSCIVKIL